MLRSTYAPRRTGTVRTSRRATTRRGLRLPHQRTSAVTHQSSRALPREAILALRAFRLWKRRQRKWRRLRGKTRSKRRRFFMRKNRAALPRKLLRRPPFRATAIRPVWTQRKQRQRRVRFFRKQVTRKIFRSVGIARACILYTRFYRQAPFEAHRPRLWDSLTLR